MKMTLREYRLPLRHPFTIARGSIREQRTLIVELEQDGARGYGEATENRYYGASIADMTAALERVRAKVERTHLEEPEALWTTLAATLAPSTFALCALDLAAHDLHGKLRGAPLLRLWGLDPSRAPQSDYTIGIDEVPVMVAKMREFEDWPIYKIKLGTAHDLDLVRELRRHTDARFRVDANCGWSAEESIRNARALVSLGVELIEQPLPPDAGEAMARVRRESALPVVADESCQREEDVARCHGQFHGINIKLVKCGGLTPARRMVVEARRLGLDVMIGCMTESTVGISAAAQLLPLADYADLDGALLLAEDVASGVRFERGRCVYPDAPGSGVTLLR